MKKIELNENVIIAELPEGTTKANLIFGLIYYNDKDQFLRSEKPPDGHYTHLKPVNELSEAECYPLVEQVTMNGGKGLTWQSFKNYGEGHPNLATARQSLMSFLRVNSLTPSLCYAVFKKLTDMKEQNEYLRNLTPEMLEKAKQIIERRKKMDELIRIKKKFQSILDYRLITH